MGAGKRLFSCAAAIMIVAFTGDARADEESCVGAFEGAQNDRMRGKLVSARARLPACLAASCPDRMRDDCARMRDELDRSTPSATFAVRTPDGVEIDATLTVDGAPVDLHAGRSQLIDPGMHVVTWTAPGEAPRTSRITIYEGEKSRLVVLRHEVAPPAAPPRVIVDEPEKKKSWLLPIALGGAGILLGATSIVFAVRSSDAEDRGAALAPRVPAGVAPCQDTSYAKADPAFCDADKDRKSSSAIAIVTGIAAVGAIGTAVALAIFDTPKPRQARITPLVGPISGASISF
jgi:hypothetical protein